MNTKNDDPTARDLEAVLEAFPALSNPTATVLAQGLIHRTFLVRDLVPDRAADPEAQPVRETILQRVNPIFRPEIHYNIQAVTEDLAKKGLETLRLLPTRDGRPFLELANGDIWRLMTRIPGTAYNRIQSPQQAHAAGRLLARFHSALDNLAYVFAPTGLQLHDLSIRLSALRRALEDHRGHALYAPVEALAAKIQRTAESLTPLENLPLRVTHGDLKLNNLLFRQDAGGEFEAVSLIDLDTLGRTPLYFDLGDAWRSWCNPSGEDAARARFDLTVFEASLRGYLDNLEFPLEGHERRSLAFGVEELSLELAARFATDALCESYFGWDATRYARAGEHNLARAHNQFSLCEQVIATRGKRLALLIP